MVNGPNGPEPDPSIDPEGYPRDGIGLYKSLVEANQQDAGEQEVGTEDASREHADEGETEVEKEDDDYDYGKAPKKKKKKKKKNTDPKEWKEFTGEALA
jgi:hypothetical protein